MQTMINGYRGLYVLFGLNLDRLLTVGAVFAGLMAGAFLTRMLAGF